MKCGDPNNPGGPYIKSNGEPCGRTCRPGFTRCNLHGGNNPSAKIKAEQMMAQARLPAIENLYEILDQFSKNTCATCGYPRGDADEKRMIIAACKTVLDRSGMGPHHVVELTNQSDGPLNLELLNDTERAELAGLLAQVKHYKNLIRARQTGQVDAPVGSGAAPSASELATPGAGAAILATLAAQSEQ